MIQPLGQGGKVGQSQRPWNCLTEYLQSLGFETDRLKTETPARVDSRTIDFSVLEPQHGDEEVLAFLSLCLLLYMNLMKT